MTFSIESTSFYFIKKYEFDFALLSFVNTNFLRLKFKRGARSSSSSSKLCPAKKLYISVRFKKGMDNNMEPIIGTSIGGNKTISVYDSNNDQRVCYKLPEAKADEFTSVRNKELKTTKKNIITLSSILALIGGIGSFYLNKNAKEGGLLIKTLAGGAVGGILGTCIIGPLMYLLKEDNINQKFIKNNM